MAEWLKASVSKIDVPLWGTEGSNPSLSARQRPSVRGPLLIKLDGFEPSCRKAVGSTYNQPFRIIEIVHQGRLKADSSFY